MLDKCSKLENIPYTLGLFLGDGHLSTSNIRIVNLDKDSLEYSCYEINRQFNTSYEVKAIGKYWRVNYGIKEIVSLFSEFLDCKNIPDYVYDFSLKAKKEFVAGLMDADGYISKGKTKWKGNRYQMGFVSTKMAQQLKTFLKNGLGCRTGSITLKSNHKINKKWEKCYQLYIPVIAFIESGLYFYCSRKQKRVEQYKTEILKTLESSETTC